MISGKRNRPLPEVRDEQGFTLLEVMIAMTIFTVFITAYLTSEGYQVSDSSMMKKELLLSKLCQNKLYEVILAPPALEESLTLLPKEGNFEEEGYPNFTYTVEYRRLKLPELKQLQGSSTSSGGGDDAAGGGGGGDEANDHDALKSAMEKQIFDTLKKNIEELIWQVKVTVKEKGTDFPYSLSTLINNSQARVKVEF